MSFSCNRVKISAVPKTSAAVTASLRLLKQLWRVEPQINRKMLVKDSNHRLQFFPYKSSICNPLWLLLARGRKLLPVRETTKLSLLRLAPIIHSCWVFSRGNSCELGNCRLCVQRQFFNKRTRPIIIKINLSIYL